MPETSPPQRGSDVRRARAETPDELRARIRTQQRRRNADQLRVLEARLGLPREPLPSCAPHHPPPFVDNRRPAAAAAAAAAEGTQGSATPARRPGPKQAGGTESAMELMPCYRRPSDARRGEMAAREGSGAGGGGGVRPPGAGVPEKVRPVKARPASPAMSDDDGASPKHPVGMPQRVWPHNLAPPCDLWPARDRRRQRACWLRVVPDTASTGLARE